MYFEINMIIFINLQYLIKVKYENRSNLYDTLLTQGRNVIDGATDLAQNVIGVGAEKRRRVTILDRSAR